MASERVVNPQISAAGPGYVRHRRPSGCDRHVIIPVIFYKQHQVINGQVSPREIGKETLTKDS